MPRRAVGKRSADVMGSVPRERDWGAEVCRVIRIGQEGERHAALEGIEPLPLSLTASVQKEMVVFPFREVSLHETGQLIY
jgi:hypothetical protein